jgi:hypothetical protein
LKFKVQSRMQLELRGWSVEEQRERSSGTCNISIYNRTKHQVRHHC